jgi:D-tyrosyl-tRNA(Tyr) deacylase
MNIAIIISTQHRVGEEDLAGKNIKEHLLKRVSWSEAGTYDHHTIYQYENIKMYTVDNECIHHEDLDKKIKADVFIFATTHTSASGIPSLAVHPIGNFHDAPLLDFPTPIF